MAAQKLVVFKHDNELGNAPAHKLFDLVSVKKEDEDTPARMFSDYSVHIEQSAVPAGVEIIIRL